MSDYINAKDNHQKYDHVFKIVFNDKKELLSLYNALTNKDYTNPDELIINTLEDAVFIGMKNDLSFIIDSYLNLYEHQSTINPNLPLRGLYYFNDLYKQYYYGNALFSSKRIELLTPQFIVFYNGNAKINDYQEIRLSDSFINKTDNPDVEVIAHVYNINYGHNQKLYDKCQKLREYSLFVERVHIAMKESTANNRSEMLFNVIDECINDNILKDILSAERNRIMETILSQFDLDGYIEMEKQYSYEDGIDAGKYIGELNSIIKLFVKNVISLDTAIDNSSLSRKEFLDAVEKYKSMNSND